jgi:hypothetical protein
MRFSDVDVPPTHVLVDFHEQLAVGKAANRHLAQRLFQLSRNLLGQGPVRGPREQHELAG